MRAAGLVLLVIGILILTYGALGYTLEKGEIKIGPIQIQVTEQEQVEVPLWLGVGAVALGGLLLLRRNLPSY